MRHSSHSGCSRIQTWKVSNNSKKYTRTETSMKIAETMIRSLDARDVFHFIFENPSAPLTVCDERLGKLFFMPVPFRLSVTNDNVCFNLCSLLFIVIFLI